MLADTTHSPAPTEVADPIPGQTDALTMSLPVRILVLQRGWVVVGRYHELTDQDGNVVEVLLDDAQVIRYWGTTRGLGQLVDGPTDTTKLDPAGVVRVHPLAVVLQIQANAQAWTDHLK